MTISVSTFKLFFDPKSSADFLKCYCDAAHQDFSKASVGTFRLSAVKATKISGKNDRENEFDVSFDMTSKDAVYMADVAFDCDSPNYVRLKHNVQNQERVLSLAEVCQKVAQAVSGFNFPSLSKVTRVDIELGFVEPPNFKQMSEVERNMQQVNFDNYKLKIVDARHDREGGIYSEYDPRASLSNIIRCRDFALQPDIYQKVQLIISQRQREVGEATKKES